MNIRTRILSCLGFLLATTLSFGGITVYDKMSDFEYRMSVLDWAHHFAAGINEKRADFYAPIRVYDIMGEKKVRLRADCSGFVHAVYSAVNLTEIKKNGATVAEMYRVFKRYGKIYRYTRPRSGDMIFFDNTWDRNGNGRDDDYLTHCAIVLSCGADGTIEFIHCSIDEADKAICSVSLANIEDMKNTMCNSMLKEWKDPDSERRGEMLAGSLINCFAAIIEVPREGVRFSRSRGKTTVRWE